MAGRCDGNHAGPPSAMTMSRSVIALVMDR